MIPAAHATSARVAAQITETGFSALSSLDAGYYGRGTYFSSSSRYTLPYCFTKKRPSVMLCLTSPGNPNPIVEDRREPNSHLGSPIQSGYQSNYVLTTVDGSPCSKVEKSGVYYDELVLDQEAQVVPVAIIEFDMDKLTPVASRFKRTTAYEEERSRHPLTPKLDEEDEGAFTVPLQPYVRSSERSKSQSESVSSSSTSSKETAEPGEKTEV